MEIYVYEAHQDDPKKCTSAKLRRFGMAKPIYRLRNINKFSLVLDPSAQTVLTQNDKNIGQSLVIIDCSWKKASEVFAGRIKGYRRRLPLLVAANPINYGHVSTLSSLEALSASLYIMSFCEEAANILTIFKWGPVFLSLNEERLKAYSKAKSEEDIIDLEEEFFRST